MRVIWTVVFAGALCGGLASAQAAEIPHPDARRGPLRHPNSGFPFVPPETQAAWRARAERVRHRTRVALGLWPEPTRTPLNAVIHGRRAYAGYTFEKVFFESMPGFFVTGSLYRPVGAKGRVPGVLCPHGHWAKGRFHDVGPRAIRRRVAKGEERFLEGGRSPLQARCVQLARMGCVVLHYDMIGYADSRQIPHRVAHGFRRLAPDGNAADGWRLFSPRAESHAQSVMGLQTWSSIRALDFLESLPDVDPKRLGVTGASGGGTQTFILSALDPRPVVTAPCVMVSTAMQGGCPCENACGLRIDTGNVELAALSAPRPMHLTAANDWTKDMATDGFPALQKLYGLLGKPKRVRLTSLVHFGHNYNHVSRCAVYGWFNRHLKLRCETPVLEDDYPRLTAEELTVWDAEHPAPRGGPAFERKLLQWWTQDTSRQLAELTPKDAESLRRFRDVVGGGWRAVVGEALPVASDVSFVTTADEGLSGHRVLRGRLRTRSWGGDLASVVILPKDVRRAVVWAHPAGTAGLFHAGRLRPEVARLAAAGCAVVGADLLFQDGRGDQPLTRTRRVENGRDVAAYTLGYNPSLFARRVHDVLSLITHARTRHADVDVVGLEGAGPWVAVAGAIAGSAVRHTALDTGGFRFANVEDLRSPDLLPGAARYLDLPGALALGVPGRLWLAGEPSLPPIIAARHQASESAMPDLAKEGATPDDAVTWLLTRR